MSFEEKLIELVREKSIIYDLKHMNYRRTDIKTKIWREIATKLKSTEHECKTKWKSLRDAYKRARRERVNSGDAAPDPDDVYQKKKNWKYYDLMNFLSDVDGQRITIGNYPSKNSESLNFCDDNSYDYIDVSDNANSITSLDDTIIASTSTPARSSETAKSSSKNDVHSNFLEFLNVASQSISQLHEPASATSTSLLFSSLAMKINNAQLPAVVIDDLEVEISNIVYSKIWQYSNRGGSN